MIEKISLYSAQVQSASKGKRSFKLPTKKVSQFTADLFSNQFRFFIYYFSLDKFRYVQTHRKNLFKYICEFEILSAIASWLLINYMPYKNVKSSRLVHASDTSSFTSIDCDASEIDLWGFALLAFFHSNNDCRQHFSLHHIYHYVTRTHTCLWW